MMNIIAGLFALICVFPFIFVVIISLTDEKVLARDGYRLIPAEWSFAAYRYLWQSGDMLLRAYGVTILVTVLGTIISLILMSLYAYAISQELPLSEIFLHLCHTDDAVQRWHDPDVYGGIPAVRLEGYDLGIDSAAGDERFYIMILRTFYSTSVPDAIIESARIDGAGEFYTFLKIVIPLSLPGLATIGLFSTLGYWNDWFNALYISIIPI